MKKFLQKVFNSLIKAIKANQGTLSLAGVAAMFVYFILTGDDNAPTMAVVLTGVTGGLAVDGEPLTTDLAEEASEGLIRPAVDSRVLRIRPSATPLDQLSRAAGSRPASNIKVEYYSVDNKDVSDTTAEAASGGAGVVSIKMTNARIFSPTDTVLLPEVHPKAKGGTPNEGDGLLLYVNAVTADTIEVASVNNYEGPSLAVPALEKGTKVVRMGRAAAELDVQTSQFEALPQKRSNYCQIFKAQIEQSAMMRLADKAVNWTLADMEESAIIDMRMAMEKSFLFGKKARLDLPGKDPVYLTGGIWSQAANETTYSGELTYNMLIDVCRSTFTGTGGSARKVLIAGSDMLASLNRLAAANALTLMSPTSRWGLDFKEIVTHFGTLYVCLSETFDHCGRAGDGMVIDPDFLVKYSHIPMRTERLDLKTSGQRNTEAVVVTEASCLVLRHPKAHMRIRRVGA